MTGTTNNTNGPSQSAGAALDGRGALVTGSSSGIDGAIATSLAHHGATVVVNSATSVAAGERLAARLPQASYLQADVSDPDQAAGCQRPGSAGTRPERIAVRNDS